MLYYLDQFKIELSLQEVIFCIDGQYNIYIASISKVCTGIIQARTC